MSRFYKSFKYIFLILSVLGIKVQDVSARLVNVSQEFLTVRAAELYTAIEQQVKKGFSFEQALSVAQGGLAVPGWAMWPIAHQLIENKVVAAADMRMYFQKEIEAMAIFAQQSSQQMQAMIESETPGNVVQNLANETALSKMHRFSNNAQLLQKAYQEYVDYLNSIVEGKNSLQDPTLGPIGIRITREA
jgi:hypothetical protein